MGVAKLGASLEPAEKTDLHDNQQWIRSVQTSTLSEVQLNCNSGSKTETKASTLTPGELAGKTEESK